MNQYVFYEKPYSHHFFGDATETLIVRDNIIVCHVRTWHDPSVVPGRNRVLSLLVSKPMSQRGKGWRKLTGFEAEQMLDVAEEWIEFFN